MISVREQRFLNINLFLGMIYVPREMGGRDSYKELILPTLVHHLLHHGWKNTSQELKGSQKSDLHCWKSLPPVLTF